MGICGSGKSGVDSEIEKQSQLLLDKAYTWRTIQKPIASSGLPGSPRITEASSENLRTLKKFVENGAEVGVMDSDGWTTLLSCSAGGHLELVKYLIEECGQPLDHKNKIGQTVLMVAASNGHLGIVQYLHQVGAKVNVMTPTYDREKFVFDGINITEGNTALMKAAQNGHLGVVKFLVEVSKANFFQKNGDGKNALDLAKEKNRVEVVQYLNTYLG